MEQLFERFEHHATDGFEQSGKDFGFDYGEEGKYAGYGDDDYDAYWGYGGQYGEYGYQGGYYFDNEYWNGGENYGYYTYGGYGGPGYDTEWGSYGGYGDYGYGGYGATGGYWGDYYGGYNMDSYMGYGYTMQQPALRLGEAVCCMPGMDCWSSAYDGAAGKEAMEIELQHLLWEYPEVKAHFNALNAVNVEKARLEQEALFAENKAAAKKLSNKVADKLLERAALVAANGLLTIGSAEAIDGEMQLVTLDNTIFELQTERDHYNEEFAIMNLQSASDNEVRVSEAIEALERQIQERRAEAEWQQQTFDSFEVMINDPTLDDEERKDAQNEADWAAELISEINGVIGEQETRKDELHDELVEWAHTKQDATLYLAEAEETRARQALAVKDAEFEAFKDEYNVVKNEYDQLFEQDRLGAPALTDAEYARMLEIEPAFLEGQAATAVFEAERTQSLRENQAKEYSNALLAVGGLRAGVAELDAQKAGAELRIVNATALQASLEAEIATLAVEIRELRGDDKAAMTALIASETAAMNAAGQEIRAAGRDIAAVDILLAEANGVLGPEEVVFAAKLATYNANILAQKEEDRAAVVRVYNQLEADIIQLNNLYLKYATEGQWTLMYAAQDEMWEKQTLFETASIDMELVNAEEARKAEEQAFADLMAERVELEEARMDDENVILLEISDIDAQLEDITADIDRLLAANEASGNQDVIDTNAEKISDKRELYFTVLDSRALKETDLTDMADVHNRERADEAAYDARAAKAAAESHEWDAEYQASIQAYGDQQARILEIEANITEYEGRQAATEWGSEEWEKFQLFLDLYYNQQQAAYDELYNVIEPAYYQMQDDKIIREDQARAQLAQDAAQRELDEQVLKLATQQSLANSLTTQVAAALEAYEASEDDATLYDAWMALTTEKDTADQEVLDITHMFEDIEANLAAEAEVARAKKMEEQKNNALRDAQYASDMYMHFIMDLEAKVTEYDSMRPRAGWNRSEIEDALSRNRAALEEAWNMYNGADDIFHHLEDMQYADEEAYTGGEAVRELDEATARLEQYTDDISSINTWVEELEYEMTETASTRQIAYLQEEIEYYTANATEIEVLQWNTEDIITGLNTAAATAGDQFNAQDDSDYNLYFAELTAYQAAFDTADATYNDLYFQAWELYGVEGEEEAMEALYEEADDWYYDSWLEASDNLWWVNEELAPIITRREARAAGDVEAAAALEALVLEEQKQAEYDTVLATYDTYYATYEAAWDAAADLAAEEALEAELMVYSREMDKFFRDLETQEAARANADAMALRRETTESMDEQMEDAMNIKEYYMTVIRNNDEKLAFFDMVYNTYTDDEYGWDLKMQLDETIQYTYDQLVSFQTQMADIDTYISDLNFDRFIVEQQWQQEDEQLFHDRVGRAESQEADYTTELAEIETAIGETYEMSLESDIEAWITASGLTTAEYNEYNNRRTDLNEWLEAVEGEIQEFEEIAEEYTAAAAADAEARMAAAHLEELARAAVERDAEEKRIKQERKNAAEAVRAIEAEAALNAANEQRIYTAIANAQTQEEYLSLDAEMQQLLEHMMDNSNALASLNSLLDQLDHAQQVIDEEKRAEELERMAVEDAQWYVEYLRVQEDMARFQEDYEAKKDDYERRAEDIQYMADSPIKVEAERLLQILKEEMQKYQVQAEVYRKQNEEYAEILQEKEERAVEQFLADQVALGERYDDTIEEYVVVREQYGVALYDFQLYQADTTSAEFETAQQNLWAIEETMNNMKADIDDMLKQRTEAEAEAYEYEVRVARETATQEAYEQYGELHHTWVEAQEYWQTYNDQVYGAEHEIQNLQDLAANAEYFASCTVTTDIVYPCAQNRHWSTADAECEDDGCDLLGGEEWGGEAAGCYCPDDAEEWYAYTEAAADGQTGECAERCTAPANWDEGEQDCFCPADYHEDVDSLCIEDECGTGEYWAGDHAGACECTTEQEWDSTTDACVDKCLAVNGEEWNGSGCECSAGAEDEWDSTTGQCEFICGTGEYWDASYDNGAGECQCETEDEWVSTECVQRCDEAAGETWDADLDTPACECIASQEWDATNTSCEDRCDETTGEEWDVSSTSCVCIASQEWDATNTSCEDRCDETTGEEWDEVDDECVCIASQEWDATNTSCEDRCDEAAGEEWDEVDDECVCEEDTKEWDATNTSCVDRCDEAAGEEWDATLVAPACVCEESTKEWDATNTSCVDRCDEAAGEEWDEVNEECVCSQADEGWTWSDPSGAGFSCSFSCVSTQTWNNDATPPACECPISYTWTDPNCVYSCVTSQFWSETNSTCECETYDEWDATNDTCEPRCTAEETGATDPMTWNTTSCECSDSRAYWDATTPNCQLHCSEEYYSGERTWDSFANSGNGECECSSGSAWGDVSRDCDDVCNTHAGETWNGAACECATTGEAWSGTYCVDECSLLTGSTWDGTSSSCVCDDISMTSAQAWNGDESACEDICPYFSGGEEWTGSGTTCVCTDAAGGQTFDSTSEACECPADESWDGIQCASRCNPGASFTGGEWDATSTSCVCTSEEFTVSYDSTDYTYTCTETCTAADNNTWDATSKECDCDATYDFDSAAASGAGECVNVVCADPEFWDTYSNACDKCVGSGQLWNAEDDPNNTGDAIGCEERCDIPNGETWNATDSTCDCPAGESWDASATPAACEDICDSTDGEQWDATLNSGAGACECSEISEEWVSTTCEDKCDSSVGEEWSDNSAACICTESNEEWSVTEAACVNRCAEDGGQMWNGTECYCPTAEVFSGDDNACVDMCPESTGQEYDSGNNNCFCPIEFEAVSPLDGDCDYNCTQDKSWDSTIEECECAFGQSMSNFSFQCERDCALPLVWDATYESCGCEMYGEVFDESLNECICPDIQTWDTDFEYCECPTGEYFDQWYAECVWDVFGYYTAAPEVVLTCEEADHFEDEYGDCEEWTCEALGERIDELVTDLTAAATIWTGAYQPMDEAAAALVNWQAEESHRLDDARQAQMDEVAEKKDTYDQAKEVMRRKQENLGEAQRALSQNTDAALIAGLQVSLYEAQDEFDLAEAEALNAEYMWDFLKAAQQADAEELAWATLEASQEARYEQLHAVEEAYSRWYDLYEQDKSINDELDYHSGEEVYWNSEYQSSDEYSDLYYHSLDQIDYFNLEWNKYNDLSNSQAVTEAMTIYENLEVAWEAAEEERLLEEDALNVIFEQQAWQDAKDDFDTEEELYNEYYAEYMMWYNQMITEQDLNLWLELQKGADAASARVAEQEYWYLLAQEEWNFQDAEKEARLAVAEFERVSGLRDEAQGYREGLIAWYEGELTGLETSIPGAREAVAGEQTIMDNNAGDAAGSDYEDAFNAKATYEGILDGFLTDEELYEDELEQLELEALWDLTAASHDSYEMAYAAYEMAEEYLEWAEEDYEDADANWYEADDELW